MKFPATDEKTPFKSVEAASAHTKIAGLTQVVSALFAYVFWLGASVFIAVLYFHYQPKWPPLAVLSALGVSPLVLAGATYRAAEKLVVIYLEHYVRKYLRVV